MNQDWIKQVLDEHEGTLLRYAYKLCGSVEIAQDAVQDTFLKLCKEDQKKIESYLLKWLFTVCRNRVFEILRKDKKMTALTDYDLETKHSEISTPDSVAQLADDKVTIRTLMQQLPAKEEEVLRLKFQNNLSYKEISEITQLSVSNVGFILHNVIKKLRGEFHKTNETAGGLA
ncbi:MAG: sigma-70 family RNA polymerase sigma factor [Lentisphaeria bacterium]|nr:sigma-70 family RNA polymerase sigma factor [Lentisphaeria bacterium]